MWLESVALVEAGIDA